MEIKYIAHPCSTTEKRAWTLKGYKVLDSRFDTSEQEKPKPKTRRSNKKAKV